MRGRQSETLTITNPYRPPVRDATTNDSPFVVKSSDELPPVNMELNCMTHAGKCETIHVETSHSVPELRKTRSPYSKALDR